MKRLWFEATLKADTALSERSATTGGHSSLDFIPGACFLGAAAGRLYADLGDAAFIAFHSGQVRYGNAYPLDSQRSLCYPTPLSWHYPKGEKADTQDGQLRNTVITNRALDSWQGSEGRQPKQLRSGYFSTFGEFVTPTRQYQLKTAIDREKGGRARDAQLFGYESLTAGSQWAFSVDIDEEVSESVIAALREVFTDRTIRVGRSRSAEFGQLSILPGTEPEQPAVSDNGPRLLLYCLTDLALRDTQFGAPTLIPTGDHFGLTDATLAEKQTYLRSRTYAPFNAKRGANDLERQVLCKGSVLAFDLAKPLSIIELKELQERLNRGVGLYRQDGLGRILVNPEFLVSGSYSPKENDVAAKTTAAGTEVPLTPGAAALKDWLEEQEIGHTLLNQAETLAQQWLKEFQPALDKNLGPGPSQWGRLRAIAQSAQGEELLVQLFDGKQGLCSHGVVTEDWQEEFYAREKRQSFADLLKLQVNEHQENTTLLKKALYLLGQMAAHRINQKEAA